MPECLTLPFKGLIYNRERIGDIGACVCPPYDVIEDPEQYYRRNPFNAIRLELPRSEGSTSSYGTALRTLEEWLRERVLVIDRGETVYVYEQEYDLQGTTYMRRGFIALNKLDRSRMLTHEETRGKAKEDREHLITALKTFTSLVFGLYEDSGGVIDDVIAKGEKEMIYDFVDEDSIRNRFYRLLSKDDFAAIAEAMDGRKIYVADGHHRLEVSFRLGLSHIPMYLTNMHSTGIKVLPYHRTVKFREQRPLKELLDIANKGLTVRPVSVSVAEGLQAVLDRIASSVEPVCGLYSIEDPFKVHLLAAQSTLFNGEGDETHESLKRLKVNLIHGGILRRMFGIKDEEISYTHDASAAAEQVRSGKADLAVFLPPTTAQEVKRIADDGLYMPPKSTFFYPKILTGLVFYKYQ